MAEKTGTNPTIYQFRIREQLDDQWRDWFGDLQMVRRGDETLLWGRVPDQAAVYGIIARMSRLGLTLLAVTGCEDA